MISVAFVAMLSACTKLLKYMYRLRYLFLVALAEDFHPNFTIFSTKLVCNEFLDIYMKFSASDIYNRMTTLYNVVAMICKIKEIKKISLHGGQVR